MHCKGCNESFLGCSLGFGSGTGAGLLFGRGGLLGLGVFLSGHVSHLVLVVGHLDVLDAVESSGGRCADTDGVHGLSLVEDLDFLDVPALVEVVG